MACRLVNSVHPKSSVSPCLRVDLVPCPPHSPSPCPPSPPASLIQGPPREEQRGTQPLTDSERRRPGGNVSRGNQCGHDDEQRKERGAEASHRKHPARKQRRQEIDDDERAPCRAEAAEHRIDQRQAEHHAKRVQGVCGMARPPLKKRFL